MRQRHQSQLDPSDNKFHSGNGDDGKHYWLTPPELYAALDREFSFTFDPCPHPKPESFDGLTIDWGSSNYVNPPFGSIIHEGRKKGPTSWARKAIAESQQGKRVVLVYPIDKWVLMLLAAGARVRNLGDVRWLSTEDGKPGKGTGRHIAAFILDPNRRGWKEHDEVKRTAAANALEEIIADLDFANVASVVSQKEKQTVRQIIRRRITALQATPTLREDGNGDDLR